MWYFIVSWFLVGLVTSLVLTYIDYINKVEPTTVLQIVKGTCWGYILLWLVFYEEVLKKELW